MKSNMNQYMWGAKEKIITNDSKNKKNVIEKILTIA